MRKFKDVIKEPTAKEIRVINRLFDVFMYKLVERKKGVPQERSLVTISKSLLHLLPDGEYKISKTEISEILTLAINQGEFVINGVLDYAKHIFTHESLFPSATVKIYLTEDEKSLFD